MGFEIRPFEANDAECLRTICCETAAEQPFLPWLDEPRLACELYLDPYLELESESCFIAARDGRIVGYIVGTLNEKQFRLRELNRVQRRLLRLLQIQTEGVINRRFSHFLSHRVLAKMYLKVLYSRLRNTARPNQYYDLDRYPANCHLQVVPEARGAGAGLALLLKFGEYLKANGVSGVHGSVVEEAGRENFSRMLLALGLRVVHEKQFTSRECPTLIHPGTWKERVLVGDF
jgi:hypothetical protein